MSRKLAVCVVAAFLAGTALPGTAAADKPDEPGPPPRRPGQVIVVAGTGEAGYSGDGFAAREARLGGLVTIDVAADGTVYLADVGNRRLRRVGTDGVIDTVPGTRATRSPKDDTDFGNGWIYSPSNRPHASDVTDDGTLYVAGANDIRRFGPNGRATVIGGGGEVTFNDGANGGDGGPATRAWIYEPADIAAGESGSVYVADTHNDRIRRIDRRGTITTIAGGGSLGPAAAPGKPATQAKLGRPDRVATDGEGTVYFSQERGRYVYRVGPDGRLAVVAEVEEEGGYGVSGIAVDGDGVLYVASAAGGIQRVGPDGKAAPLTGVPYAGTVFDLAVGPDGDLYVSGSYVVKRLVRSGNPPERTLRPGRSPWADDDPGTIHHVAGTGREPAKDDPDQVQRADGQPDGPSSVAVGPDGTVYVAETNRHRVRAIGPDGRVRPFAGTGEDSNGGDGKPAEQASLSAPMSVAVDPEGYVLIADARHRTIHRVDPDGIIDTVAENIEARQLVAGPNGTAYLTAGAQVYRLGEDGRPVSVAGGGERWAEKADGAPARQASLSDTGAVAAGGGWVYFAEAGRPSVRAVRPDGVLVTVAGDSYRGFEDGGFAGDGGPAVRAELNQPTGLAVGPDGARYVADTYNNRIRRVDRAGVITTVAGTGERADRGDGGPATKAALSEPTSVAVGRDGALYVTSTTSSRVRRIDPDGTIDTLADLYPPTADRKAAETDLGTLSTLAVGVDGTVYLDTAAGLRTVARDGTLDSAVPGDVGFRAGGSVAQARDGSLLVLSGATLERRYPDGGVLHTPLGGPERKPTDAPADLPEFRHLATGPRDEVYVGGPTAIHRVAEDGSLDQVYGRRGSGDLGAFTVGQDGSLYLLDDDQVLRVRDGKAEPVTAAEATYRPAEEEDGGPAIEASLSYPGDLAVTEDGTLFVTTLDGVRRVDTDGDIETVVPSTTNADDTISSVDALAVGPGGDLYLGYAKGKVDVLVRPGEMSGSSGSAWLFWFGGAVLVLAGAALTFVLRRRAAAQTAGGPADQTPTEATAESTTETTETTGETDEEAAAETADETPGEASGEPETEK